MGRRWVIENRLLKKVEAGEGLLMSVRLLIGHEDVLKLDYGAVP